MKTYNVYRQIDGMFIFVGVVVAKSGAKAIAEGKRLLRVFAPAVELRA